MESISTEFNNKKMEDEMKKELLYLLVVIALIAALAGCAQPAPEEPAVEEPAAEEPAAEEPMEEEPAAEMEELHIVYVTPSTESGYWGEYVKIGVENAIKDIEEEYGVPVKYEYQGPALEASQDEFLSILEGVIAKEPDGIALGQLYPDSVKPLVEQAAEKGIRVNFISIGIEDLADEDFGAVYYCDQPEQGAMAAQAFYDAMVEKGLPMDGTVGVHMSVVVPILEQKIQNFVDTLQELGPELTILETQYNENDINNGIALMEGQLATYGDDLVGFFGGNNVTGDAIVRVIEESGRADSLVGVAVDSDPVEIEGMRNGYLDALVVQTPYDQAYNATKDIAVYVIDGTSGEKWVNMSASVVTPANMDEPEMQALLDPTILAR
jgi:ribose transport system substrate-binding protein